MIRVLAVTCVFFLSILSRACAGGVSKEVCFKNACVKAEIADSDYTRQMGLMFRQGLSLGQGMLFIFGEEGRHAFWMKNVEFPLDIIWISEEKQVVYMVSGVLPCDGDCETILPNKEAKYVLEVGAGFIEKHDIKIGDEVRF